MTRRRFLAALAAIPIVGRIVPKDEHYAPETLRRDTNRLLGRADDHPFTFDNRFNLTEYRRYYGPVDVSKVSMSGLSAAATVYCYAAVVASVKD
jgi:hypothetical protein